MFTTANNPFSLFINLLDTPSEYKPGKLLIFDTSNKKVVAVDLVDVPSLVDGILEGLRQLVADSDTISFEVVDNLKAYVKQYSLNHTHFDTDNQPENNTVLLYRNGQLTWAKIESNVAVIEAKEQIQAFQCVTYDGRVATNVLPVTNKAMGLALNDADQYDQLYVMFNGKLINVNWSFTPAVQIYLGENGAMTTIAPTTNGKFLQKIGTAITEDIVLFKPEQDIILL